MQHLLIAISVAIVAASIAIIVPRSTSSQRKSKGMAPTTGGSAMTDYWHASKDPDRTMRAVVYERHSPDPAGLKLAVVPRPAIRPHQVLVQVRAAAINPVDFKFRRGAVPSFMLPKPKIPGQDVAGVVVEVGDQANAIKGSDDAEWKVGDRVAAMVPSLLSPWGTLAEYVAVDAKLLGRIPDNFPGDSHKVGDVGGGADVFASAASLPLVALTVVRAFDRVGYEDWTDKKVLIQAGAGGVGSFAVQYVKHVLKASAVATTASAAKAPLLERLGADLVIDYRTTPFEDAVQDYDVVLDPMSWTYEKRTLQSNVLKPTGWYLK
jgi:alcohol dehydrogenase